MPGLASALRVCVKLNIPPGDNTFVVVETLAWPSGWRHEKRPNGTDVRPSRVLSG